MDVCIVEDLIIFSVKENPFYAGCLAVVGILLYERKPVLVSNVGNLQHRALG